MSTQLIRPEEGQAQPREVCHERAIGNLDLPVGTQFAEVPLNAGVRVKLSPGSDVCFGFSHYELADLSLPEFRPTVRYLGRDEREVASSGLLALANRDRPDDGIIDGFLTPQL